MKGTLLVRVLGMLRMESVLEQVYTKGSWSWDPISLHWTMAFDKCCVECLASGPDIVLARHDVGASPRSRKKHMLGAQTPSPHWAGWKRLIARCRGVSDASGRYHQIGVHAYMLCCCEIMLCLLCKAAQRARTQSGIRGMLRELGLVLGAQGNESDKLMGKLVKVALNRGDESLSRVGKPSWRVELRCQVCRICERITNHSGLSLNWKGKISYIIGRTSQCSHSIPLLTTTTFTLPSTILSEALSFLSRNP